MASSTTRDRSHLRLVKALEELSETDALVLDLTYEQELTTGEISEILDLPEAEVAERRHLALESLRENVAPVVVPVRPNFRLVTPAGLSSVFLACSRLDTPPAA